MRRALQASSDLPGALKYADVARRYIWANYDIGYGCVSTSRFEIGETIEIMKKDNMNDLNARMEYNDGFDLIDLLDWFW